jgi:colanic acid/amylovoran biosynthesis glycosyltransferase
MSDKRRLILITQSFPYQPGDAAFIKHEFAQLIQSFSCVVIDTHTTETDPLPLPDGVRTLHFDSRTKITGAVRALCRRRVWKEMAKAKRGVCLKQWLVRARAIISQDSKAETFGLFLEREQLLSGSGSSAILYTFWKTPLTLACARLKKKYPALQLVTRSHGIDLYIDRMSGKWSPFGDEINDGVDRFLFISQHGLHYYQTLFQCADPGKYRVRYLGTPDPNWQTRICGDVLKIVSCAFISPVKDIKRTIDALALASESLRIEWRHIGDGPDCEDIHNYAASVLGKRRNVSYDFLGYIPNDSITDCYKSINPHLFISTSLSEGLPVSMMEACAVGLPVLATSVGGVSEIVFQGENGYLLPADAQPAAIARSIELFGNLSVSEKQAMGDASHRIWEKYFDCTKNAKVFAEELLTL